MFLIDWDFKGNLPSSAQRVPKPDPLPSIFFQYPTQPDIKKTYLLGTVTKGVWAMYNIWFRDLVWTLKRQNVCLGHLDPPRSTWPGPWTRLSSSSTSQSSPSSLPPSFPSPTTALLTSSRWVSLRTWRRQPWRSIATMSSSVVVLDRSFLLNIAKGTTDPRVEFCLPK